MQMAMIGLGRMGGNMVERLMREGHQTVVYDRTADAVAKYQKIGSTPAKDLADVVGKLQTPRVVWIMVPAGAPTEDTIRELVSHLERGDIIIDGGNSNFHDTVRRAKELATRGIEFVDSGTSGGIWGLENGYCLMVGGSDRAVKHCEPIFRSLAPEDGYAHVGPSGAGHYVKMVHNGIEYGLMAAYAEGLNIIKNANIGLATHEVDAETTPLRHPEHYRYDIDIAKVAEVWRRGSVVGSWLLDLTASALRKSPDLANFQGRVSDSGEGRWTLQAAIEEGIPAPVISAALFSRFSSRGNAGYADKILSALRFEFGGHHEKPAS